MEIEQQISFGVVILAAGASKRMGRQKLLLPWGTTRVLGHLLEQWIRLGARQIAVVCAANARDMEEELTRISRVSEQSAQRVSPVFNPAPERGMFSSVQCAAKWPGWNAELTHWIVTLGDQPQLKESTLKALLNFGAMNPGRICQPLRNGRRKHPVLLPARFFSELKNTTANDLKLFLVEHAPHLAGFESDDAGLDLDMDTPEDYERACQLSFGTKPS